MGSARTDVIQGISEAAAEALEIPIEELPPLSEVVDPDALDELVTPTTGSPATVVTVTFKYAELDVFVSSSGIVYARPVLDSRNPLAFAVASEK
jgi:hypothetical protein